MSGKYNRIVKTTELVCARIYYVCGEDCICTVFAKNTVKQRGNMSEQNNSQKYNDLGIQIKDSVMQAINSGDFSGLSDSISKSVTTVLGDVGDSINKAAAQARYGTTFTDAQMNYRNTIARSQAEIMKAQAEARARAQAEAARFHAEQAARIERNKQQRAMNMRRPLNLIKFTEVGSISSPFAIAGGIILLGFGFLLVVSAIGAAGELGMIITGVVSAAIGLMLTVLGGNKQKWLKKASKIRSMCLERCYCTVDEIAAATGVTKKKAIKDIKKILEKGFFPEGFVDEEYTTFMATRGVYEQYMQTKKNQQMQAAERLKEQGVEESARVGLSPEQQTELDAMMTDGRSSIRKLHELNEQIPGQSITEKLYMTEGLLNDIFNRVKEEPAQMKNCRRLMDYHLPTVIKLVEAYAEYDKISNPGQEIVKAKEEIEKTLDLINQAFGELLNRLFQDSVWDVTSDAQVLKSMLAQEGLAKDIVVNEEV